MSESSRVGGPPPPRGGRHPGADAVARLFDSTADSGELSQGYELIRTLGRGAMGEIVLARQRHLNRLVALKMIRRELSGPGFNARFLAEAETVARLHHPNIVQIFEFGELDGRPFFALEYMEGGSLDRQLNGTPLATRRAAQLVQCLADAVQHAHERGIIHRDLKPANVLLTGDGMPKVADFGLSQLVHDEPRTEDDAAGVRVVDFETVRIGAVVGTPSYMAPEQAAGEVSRISATTDVYALGAILYECLTGRPPFRGATASETIEQVKWLEPAPVRQLRQGVPHDVDTICHKCLQKDPARRYATAKELADDLGRFQRGEPVRARPVGALVRLGKWVRRKPLLAGLSAVATLSLLAVIVGGMVYQSLLRKALVRSEKNYEQALAAVDRLLTRVGQERLLRVPEMEAVRAELLNDALEFYQRFMDGTDDADPAIQFETARAMMRVARIKCYLSRYDESHAHALQAIGLLQSLTGRHPSQRDYLHELADAHVFDASLAHTGVSSVSVGEQLAQARRILSALADERANIQLATCDHEEALWHVEHTRLNEAEQAYRRAIAARRRLLTSLRSDEVRSGLAMSLHNLAGLCWKLGRMEAALGHEQEAVAEFETLSTAPPRDDDLRLRLAATLNSLGCMQTAAQKWPEARGSLERSLKVREEMAAAHPRVLTVRESVAESCLNLTGLLVQMKLGAEAETAARRSVDVMEKLCAESPGHKHYETLVSAQQNYAHALQTLDRFEEAGQMYDRAIATLRVMISQSANVERCQTLLAAACINRGNVDRQREQPAAALPWYQHAIDAANAALATDARLNEAKAWRTSAHGARAQTYETLKQFDAAVRDWDRVVEWANEPLRTDYRVLRAETLARSGQGQRALTEARDLARWKAKEWTYLSHLARVCAIAGDHETEHPRRDDSHREAVMLFTSAWQLADWHARFEMANEAATHPDWGGMRQRMKQLMTSLHSAIR